MTGQGLRRRVRDLEQKRGARPILVLFQDMGDPDLYHTEPRSWPPYLEKDGDQLYHESDLEAAGDRHTLIVCQYQKSWPP